MRHTMKGAVFIQYIADICLVAVTNQFMFTFVSLPTSRHIFTFCVIVEGVFYSKASVHVHNYLA